MKISTAWRIVSLVAVVVGLLFNASPIGIFHAYMLFIIMSTLHEIMESDRGTKNGEDE